MTQRLTMDFPVLPPLRMGSFPSTASTIESQNILPMKSIETKAQRPSNKTQKAIDGKFRVFVRELSCKENEILRSKSYSNQILSLLVVSQLLIRR
jgi:hypothetical protein